MLPRPVTGLSRSIGESHRSQAWVTPSGKFGRPQIECIRKVLGAERIIWSCDHPDVTLDGTREFLETLPVSDGTGKRSHTVMQQLFGF